MLSGTHRAETADECARPTNRRVEKSTPCEGEERKEYVARANSAADQYSRYEGLASSFWFRTELLPWFGLSMLQTSLIFVLAVSKWSSIGSNVSLCRLMA